MLLELIIQAPVDYVSVTMKTRGRLALQLKTKVTSGNYKII